MLCVLDVRDFHVIFLLDSCFGFMLLFCVMGVKNHSPLGGKRCLGEGVSWAHSCS